MAVDYFFYLDIPAEEYLRYYSGRASAVVVRANNGLRVRFPASAIRRFVTRDGIQGRFHLKVDENNRLLSLERV
ncbi:MAG: DUF2835 domain-containing protein [Chromatiales bacterium]|nr:DUF2835 domain-containing protein [Chromatiales bacterium]MDX9767714.1 DUF2835 domain-containing protein [Ectothiorhodospiraceae bacterium]